MTAVRAVVALVSAVALAGLTGCTSSSTGDDAGGPGAADPSGSATAATPGKYQSLPEPCGSVNRAALTAVLPQSADYRGTPALTYDNDRRVGCKWSGTADGVSRTLTIDVERVVSYDPAVSDDDRAHQDFARQAGSAHVPDGAAVPEAALATPQPGASDAPVAGGAGGHAVSAVTGIGDEGYLADVATTGPAAGRGVTFVFRAANVVVTVGLSQLASTDSDAALQLGANRVAAELAHAITQ